MVSRIEFGTPGVPAFQSDDGHSQVDLLIGDVPANGAPVDYNVPQNSSFPLFAVVGNVGNVPSGDLAWAKADGSIKAVGVLMVGVVTGAGETKSARAHTSGHFNANALKWDPSFDTLAKKVAAFPPGTSNVLIGVNPYDPTFT